jgi:hypothetical protein
MARQEVQRALLPDGSIAQAAFGPLLERENSAGGFCYTHLCSMLEFDLVELMFKTELSSFPLALMEHLGLSKPKEPGMLRRELDALTEYEVLDPARYFKHC